MPITSKPNKTYEASALMVTAVIFCDYHSITHIHLCRYREKRDFGIDYCSAFDVTGVGYHNKREHLNC